MSVLKPKNIGSLFELQEGMLFHSKEPDFHTVPAWFLKKGSYILLVEEVQREGEYISKFLATNGEIIFGRSYSLVETWRVIRKIL